MMSLAGVPLVLEYPGNDQTLKIENLIERYISMSSYLPWLRPSNPPPNSPGLTFHWPRPERKMRLFRLVWPQGASRWAHGHYLASSDQVTKLISLAYDEDGAYKGISLLIGTPEIGDQAGIPGTSVNIIDALVYLLPPTPLSGIRGLTGQTQSLYLITVVDQRFFWWRDSTIVYPFDKTTEWSDLYTQIRRQLDINEEDFIWDDIPPQYLKPAASMFRLEYQQIPPILDAIAFNIGQRVVVQFDGTVLIQNSGTSYQFLTNDFDTNAATRIIMAGGQRFNDPL